MKKTLMTIVLLMGVLLAACNGTSTSDNLNANDKEPSDIKELVHDYSVGDLTAQSASITSTQLIINDDNEESVHDLPDEEFFVSIAPFINETHPCEIHSLTGCQGELVDKDFDFYIEDMDGNVVVAETINSGSNGFIDLWLPRNQTYNVTISYEGKQVQSELSTFEEDGTCITTMQLT